MPQSRLLGQLPEKVAGIAEQAQQSSPKYFNEQLGLFCSLKYPELYQYAPTEHNQRQDKEETPFRLFVKMGYSP
jgi:hypothetical protein